jgi:hypothetical protein
MGPMVLSLTIEESGDACRIIARTDSKERDTDIKMLPESLRQHLLQLQEAILTTPRARRVQLPSAAKRAESTKVDIPANRADRVAARPGTLLDAARSFTKGADERIVQEIGSQLFDFIFQKKVLDLYDECYREAKKNQRPLLIRVWVKHPHLSYVPWETVYDNHNRFHICLSQYTPFARCIGFDDENDALPSGRPIRILGMAARVRVLRDTPLDSIDVDGEQVTITKALQQLEQQKKVRLCWTPSAAARDLNRRLIKGDEGRRWDVFHFIGHGGVDPDRGGFLVVQEEGGPGGTKLYADDLRNFLIQPGRTPILAILNSCSGAESQPGELFSSTAVELVQGGIPAVVAMQFEISDRMGLAFSEAFYTYLADGIPIHQALASTRADLKANGFAEWISPVLYMRTADGNIFRDVGLGEPS